MISSHRMIYNIFGSGIYHKPHFIFKSKPQDFHNKNIGILEEMKLVWMDISWGHTENCGCEKFFSLLHHLQSSLVLLVITSSTKQ